MNLSVSKLEVNFRLQIIYEIYVEFNPLSTVFVTCLITTTQFYVKKFYIPMRLPSVKNVYLFFNFIYLFLNIDLKKVLYYFIFILYLKRYQC